MNNPTHFACPSRPASEPSHQVTQNLHHLLVLHFVCFEVLNEIQSQVDEKTDTGTPKLQIIKVAERVRMCRDFWWKGFVSLGTEVSRKERSVGSTQSFSA